MSSFHFFICFLFHLTLLGVVVDLCITSVMTVMGFMCYVLQTVNMSDKGIGMIVANYGNAAGQLM